MKTPFKLVVFDCDGVLADSERITAQVLAQCLAEQGVCLDWHTVLQHFIGGSAGQDRKTAEALVGRTLPETFWQDFFTRAHTKLAAQTKPVPHIKTVLGSLKLPYCTASNGSLDKMHTTLGACRLLEYFSGKMFSAEQVAAGKPAPDVFLLAARQMGVPPQHCAVVEGSPVGVRAATAAGMSVFGYAALTPADALLQAGAAQTFDDMRRLPELLGCPAADSAA